MTEKDLRLIFARNKQIVIRLELLNSSYQVVEELQGKATQFPVNISNNSDIRSTASLTLVVEDGEAAEGVSQKIWLDNMVRAYAVFEDVDTGENEEYLIGSFLFTDNTYSYDAATQELSLSLVDMMASATSARGSQIGYDTLVPAGSNMRNALISTVARFSNFKRYNVPEFDDPVYYDVETSRGSYGYSILSGLMAMHPTYQMFYNKEGVFTVQPIPTKIEDPVEIDNDIMDMALIKEEKNDSMSEVANVIEIWGKEIEPDFIAAECLTSGNVYKLLLESGGDELNLNAKYSFTPLTNSVEGQKIQINDLDVLNLIGVKGDGTEYILPANEMKANRNYAIQYAGDGKAYFIGETLIHVIAKEVNKEPSEEEKQAERDRDGCEDIIWIVNPDSKYAVERIKEVKRVLTGNDYADIYTTQLGYERAKYELWKKTRQQETVTIQCLLIPTLDVNTKIAYTSSSPNERQEYLVQSISADYANGVMTLTCTRFYPYYPF